MALGSTKPLTEMSRADNFATICEPYVWSGSLNL
jgi:hypothetical protein